MAIAAAAMGFVATVLAARLSSGSSHRTERESRLLEARMRTYGECSDSLVEYARANDNRAKARIAGQPEEYRGEVRQEAYRCNARARSASTWRDQTGTGGRKARPDARPAARRDARSCRSTCTPSVADPKPPETPAWRGGKQKTWLTDFFRLRDGSCVRARRDRPLQVGMWSAPPIGHGARPHTAVTDRGSAARGRR